MLHRVLNFVHKYIAYMPFLAIVTSIIRIVYHSERGGGFALFTLISAYLYVFSPIFILIWVISFFIAHFLFRNKFEKNRTSIIIFSISMLFYLAVIVFNLNMAKYLW